MIHSKDFLRIFSWWAQEIDKTSVSSFSQKILCSCLRAKIFKRYLFLHFAITRVNFEILITYFHNWGVAEYVFRLFVIVSATRRKRDIKILLYLTRVENFNIVMNNHGRMHRCDFLFSTRNSLFGQSWSKRSELSV